MLVCENYIFIDIFDTSVNFYISHDEYFHVHVLYIMFFNNFSLPDVASSFIPLSNIRSVPFTVCVIVMRMLKLIKQKFVLINASGELTETLH